MCAVAKGYSKWVCKGKVGNDTPPNEDECSALEEAKFEDFKATFKEDKKKLQRITSLVESKTMDIYTALDNQ
eukprot:10445913-Ditylum_brightwellii.AAC.1